MPTGNRSDAGHFEGDRLGARRQPRVERGGPHLLENPSDLRPEPVGVVELHHPSPEPGIVVRWPRVALHRDDVVTATGQHTPDQETGWPRADDRDPHVTP